MTLQYNISHGQAGRPALPRHGARRALGGAVAISIVLHVTAVAIAVLAFGRHAPAAEDPAAITVFVPPAPPAPAVETAESKPTPEPPPPEPQPPLPDFAPPPPEEALAVPDFKPPPPPPVAAPPPKPRPVPARPPVVAAPQPAPAPSASPPPMVPPVAGAPSPTAAPSIVPGWNVQLAAWLAAHKTYPSASRQRGEEGEVMVSFTVDDTGRVIAVSIDKGSGHADLDAAALRMFQGATLPAPGATATRTVRIRFRLDD